MGEPIYVDVEQGTYAWEQCRIGLPTASRYSDLLTPAKLQLSKGCVRYRNELLAEWIAGYPTVEAQASDFMERGTELEDETRAFYAFERGVQVRQVGFVYRSDRRTGCSPDGLIGDDGGLEIKNPSLHHHIGYLVDPDSLVAEYRIQVQGSLYITGRAWWDVLAYSPILPPVIVRVEPEPVVFEALHAALGTFLDDLDDWKRKLAEHRQPRVKDGTLSPLPGDEPTFLEELLRESLQGAAA